MNNKIFFLIFTIICSFKLLAQNSGTDTSTNIPMFQLNYNFSFPGGALAQRFGVSSSVGPSVMIKTKSNLLLGVGYSYIFGNKVKEDSLFKLIKTSSGEIIDGNGTYGQVYVYERGFYTAIYVGHVFNLLAANKNSGLCVLLSTGLLQHKIRIDNPLNTVPQLRGEYKKGYDRLTNGPAISEFVGYYYFGNKRLLSFYAGFEFIQAWTKCRRDYNFDDMAPDNKKRFDMLSGIKAGWIISLAKKKKNDYYFY